MLRVIVRCGTTQIAVLVDTIRSVINQLFDIMNYCTKLDNVYSIGEIRTVIGGVHFSGNRPISGLLIVHDVEWLNVEELTGREVIHPRTEDTRRRAKALCR